MNRLLTASCGLAATGIAVVLGAGPAVAAQSQNPFFNSCAEASAAGYKEIPSTQSGYRPALDRDRDGVACEDGEGSGSASSSTNGSGSTGSLSTGGTGAGTSGGGSGTIRINTGTGGQADPGSSALPALIGGAGVLVLGGSVLALRRRNGVATRG
jgi:hypothetical protein